MPTSIKSGPYGARLGPGPGVTMIFIAISELGNEFDLHIEITSGREGKHMRGSIHLVDMAFDYKFYSVSANKLIEYGALLKDRLGDDYDISVTTSKRIIHIEYQPKDPLGKLPA
jgi:hypothetical protein